MHAYPRTRTIGRVGALCPVYGGMVGKKVCRLRELLWYQYYQSVYRRGDLVEGSTIQLLWPRNSGSTQPSGFMYTTPTGRRSFTGENRCGSITASGRGVDHELLVTASCVTSFCCFRVHLRHAPMHRKRGPRGDATGRRVLCRAAKLAIQSKVAVLLSWATAWPCSSRALW